MEQEQELFDRVAALSLEADGVEGFGGLDFGIARGDADGNAAGFGFGIVDETHAGRLTVTL